MFDVVVVIPCHNGAQFLEECLVSVARQQFDGTFFISFFDDASTDDSAAIAHRVLGTSNIGGTHYKIVRSSNTKPLGVASAKNEAILQAPRSKYLCFCDADDVMCSIDRIQLQYNAAMESRARRVMIGSRVRRDPADSTVRFTRWCNSLTQSQLYNQAYTSHGPTLIAPTWFVSRDLFDDVGGFTGSFGDPEDLTFFYRALRLNDTFLGRVDQVLVSYRYHAACASLGVSEEKIWNARVTELQDIVLPRWESFTIWSAGKQGKRLFHCLSAENQAKVKCLCDVDERKVKRGVYEFYDERKRAVTKRVAIRRVDASLAPFVICVKLDMTDGDLERKIEEMNLKEGIDFIHFS